MNELLQKLKNDKIWIFNLLKHDGWTLLSVICLFELVVHSTYLLISRQ